MIFAGPGVPPSFVELPARDGRSESAAVDVLLVIRIVDLVDEQDAPARPVSGVVPVTRRERRQTQDVVAVGAGDRVAQSFGDSARLARELGRLVVDGVAAGDQRLRAGHGVGRRQLERPPDPVFDKVRLRRDTPHSCSDHRLEGKFRVEIRRGQIVVSQLDRALHRRGERLAVEVDGVSVTNLPPDLYLCVSARFELDRALKQ